MSKKTPTPNIRFTPFSKDWIIDKLGNHVFISTGDCVTTNQSFDYGYPIISGGKEPMGFLNRYNRNENTVTVARAGTAGYVMFQKEKFYLNDKCFSLENDDQLVPLYLYYYLKSNQDKIESLKVASSVPTINTQHLKSFDILIPEKQEQEQIGCFLDKLDSSISLYQDKSNKIASLKRSLFKKMFPNHLGSNPVLRFKTFENDWSKKRIGDEALIVAGGTPSTAKKEYWNPKEIPWLSSGEVHKKRIDFADNMISKLGLDNSSARWIPENSVLIALAGQGKTRGTVAINNIRLTTNQSIAAITFNSNFDTNFVFSNLESRYEELRSISSADGSRGGLNKQLISNVEIPFTTINEQIAVGALFENLDKLTKAYNDKLVLLRNLKSSLLEKMFA